MRVSIQVRLAPTVPVQDPVLLASPFTLAQELVRGTVYQQAQRGVAGTVGHLNPRCLQAAAHGAAVGHFPVNVRKAQWAFNQPQAPTLTQGQAELTFSAQAELNACVGEDALASTLNTGRGVPRYVFDQPDRQSPQVYMLGVVSCPIVGLVAGLGAFEFSYVTKRPVQGIGFV